jgi:ABC-2 type transport system ATP-binding protein
LCDRVAVMEGGRIVAIDTPAQLVARHGGGLVIRCRFAGAVAHADLAALPGITDVAGPDGVDGRFTSRADELDRALFALLNFAERADAPVVDLQVHQPGLEVVFLTLTGRALRD